MKKIADRGGLIGIGYWDGAVGEDITPANIVDAIAYAVDLVGEDHVCLGSDFGGNTTTGFDTLELAVLTMEMEKKGVLAGADPKNQGENTFGFCWPTCLERLSPSPDQLPGEAFFKENGGHRQELAETNIPVGIYCSFLSRSTISKSHTLKLAPQPPQINSHSSGVLVRLRFSG